MQRRELLETLGVAGSGLLFVSGSKASGAQKAHAEGAHAECLKACQECSQECNETFHHCLMELAQGKKEHARSLRLAVDCAKFCNLSADLVASKSPLMVHSCAACAEACKACAAECDKFDSTQMKDCAQACRACESTCRAMVKAMS